MCDLGPHSALHSGVSEVKTKRTGDNHDQTGLHPRIQGRFDGRKSTNTTHDINKSKEKDHTFISRCQEGVL